jgi:pimeloyl-ACP methyl ester carboxylesterase
MNRTIARSLLLACLAISLPGAQVTTDVSFTATNDGTQQKYVRILPVGFDSAQYHDVLIALHGAGSDRWQFATDARDECRAARDAATQNDMVYISPDYRGYTSFMGIKAEQDVVQIIHDLRAEYKVNGVFITGASMGGMSCLTFTALHPDLIDGVASMNGTGNFFEWPGGDYGPIVESFGGAMADFPLGYLARSAEFWPHRFVMPVGIAASGNDGVVPPQSAMRMAYALKDVGKTVLSIFEPYGGHATNYADGKAILDFVLTTWNESAAPSITAQPSDATVMEGGQATFSVVGDRGHFYTWLRNGTAIPDAYLPQLSFAASTADNGAKYRCVVRNNKGRDTSDEATLTVVRDTAAPRIASVTAASTQVTVVFSEGVNAAAAQTAANYSISNDVTVLSATLAPSNTYYRGVYDTLPANAVAAINAARSDRAVILATSAMSAGSSHALTVNGITDNASSPNPIAPNSNVAFTATSGQLPNHDFETGNLDGWTIVSGTAFSACEITSGSGEGNYCLYAQNCWSADAPFGVLRSANFTVAGSGVIDALVSGGYEPGALYFALVRASDGAILYRALNNSRTNAFARVKYDASAYVGTEAYVQLVDSSSTADWGHINLDDVNILRTDPLPVAANWIAACGRTASPAFSAQMNRAGVLILRNVPPSVSANQSLTIAATDLAGRLAQRIEVTRTGDASHESACLRLAAGVLPAGWYAITVETNGVPLLRAPVLVQR